MEKRKNGMELMKIMGMMIFILTNDPTSEEEREELGDD